MASTPKQSGLIHRIPNSVLFDSGSVVEIGLSELLEIHSPVTKDEVVVVGVREY